MELKKLPSVEQLQDLVIKNNDKKGFYGDGKNIPVIDLSLIHI